MISTTRYTDASIHNSDYHYGRYRIVQKFDGGIKFDKWSVICQKFSSKPFTLSVYLQSVCPYLACQIFDLIEFLNSDTIQ